MVPKKRRHNCWTKSKRLCYLSRIKLNKKDEIKKDDIKKDDIKKDDIKKDDIKEEKLNQINDETGILRRSFIRLGDYLMNLRN